MPIYINLFWCLLLAIGLSVVSCSSGDTKGESDSGSNSSTIGSREMSLPAPEKDECSEGDCSSGNGTFRWTSGDIYKGNFKDGKRDGVGAYRWKSGATYTGDWKDGMRDGEGLYTYPNGDTYKGQFKADKRDGKGIYTYSDGTVHPSKMWSEGKPVK